MHRVTRLASITAFLSFGLPVAAFAQILPVEVPTGKLAQHPYRFSGLISSVYGDLPIRTPGGGSGTCALHPKLIFGCAHAVMDVKFASVSHGRDWVFNKNAEYPKATTVLWLPRYQADTVPDLSFWNSHPGGIPIRNMLTGEGYQEWHGLAWDPEKGPKGSWRSSELRERAESRDFAIFWGYETMSGDYAPCSSASGPALKSATTAKLSVGYPAPDNSTPELEAASSHIIHGRLYETDIGARAYDFYGYPNFKSEVLYPLPVGSVAVLNGNSGGGVWVRPTGQSWELAGVTLLGDGGMLPLDATHAKKKIDEASVKVGKIVPLKKGPYNFAPNTFASFYLGQTVAEIDTFKLTIPADGHYEIKTLDASPNAGLDTVGTLSGNNIVSLADGITKSVSDDNSGDDGKNFRMRLYLLKGVYTLTVRGAYPTAKGAYALFVTPLAGDNTQQIQVKAAGKTAPLLPDTNPTRATTAIGTHFGTMTAKAPAKTLTFSILNTGGGPLSLTGSPRVSLAGPHASQFTVVSQPSDSVIPARAGKVISSTTFSIRYQPTITGNHFTRVHIESNSQVNPEFRFAIRGTAPPTFAAPLGDLSHLASASVEVPGWAISETTSSSALDYGGDIDTFRYVLTQKRLCTFFTTGGTDTFGTLYSLNGTRATKVISSDVGGESRNFRLTKLLNPGTYVVEVKGSTADVIGDYEIHALQAPVQAFALVTNAKGLPVNDDSTLIDATLNTDFGLVDSRKGYVDRVFTLTNNGYADLSLNGSPKVQVSGTGAAAFSIVKQPTVSLLKPAAKVAFTVRYDPAATGTNDAVISLPLTDPTVSDGTYNFAVQGTGYGAVTPLKKATGIAASKQGSFFLASNGTIQAWGGNYLGKLGVSMGGNSENSTVTTPTNVTFAPAAIPVAIASGGYRTHMALPDGSVYGWGDPVYVGMGDGAIQSTDMPMVTTPIQANRAWSPAKITEMALGSWHTVLLTDTGGVWAWGQQDEGEVGNGVITGYKANFSNIKTTPVSISSRFGGAKVIQVAAGANHSLALDAEGTVWAWGVNFSGQLGLGSVRMKSTPTKILASAFGNQRIVGVACGAHSSYALTESGVLWAWGDNKNGAVGDGTTTLRFTPVMVMDPVTQQAHAFGGQAVIQMVAGADQAFVLTADGAVWTWGEAVAAQVEMKNPFGHTEAELETWTSVSLSPRLLVAAPALARDQIIEMAAAGERSTFWGDTEILAELSLCHALFLRRNGSVWAYGANGNGQVGDGTYIGRPSPVMVAGGPLPGQADDGLIGDANNTVYSMATQPDGKVLVGGAFTSIAGETHNRLARFNADGTLDSAFAPNLNGDVYSITVLPDGKIMVGGGFTTVNGGVASRIARLLPDGSPDSGFSMGADSFVMSLGLQSDGKIVMGGFFGYVGGEVRNGVARLNANGTLDTDFNPNADSFVRCTVVLPGNRIMIGGAFTSVGGTTRRGLARLLANGSVDTSFTTDTPAGSISAIATQPNGSIVVGGQFNSVGGIGRNNLARIGYSGTVDQSFNPGTDTNVYCLALQADGKIVVGGLFSTVAGTTRNSLARLNANGTLDADFNPNANSWVYAVSLRDNGRIIAGGNFTTLNGEVHARFVQLGNQSGTQSLTHFGNSYVEWLRDGTLPEVSQVTFELSTNGGASWTLLGSAAPDIGGWSLPGLSLPSSGLLRARGRATQSTGSSGLTEMIESLNY